MEVDNFVNGFKKVRRESVKVNIPEHKIVPLRALQSDSKVLVLPALDLLVLSSGIHGEGGYLFSIQLQRGLFSVYFEYNIEANNLHGQIRIMHPMPFLLFAKSKMVLFRTHD